MVIGPAGDFAITHVRAEERLIATLFKANAQLIEHLPQLISEREAINPQERNN